MNSDTNTENEAPPHNPQYMPSTTLTRRGENHVNFVTSSRPVGPAQPVGPAPAAPAARPGQGGGRSHRKSYKTHRKKKTYRRKSHKRKTHRR